VILRGDTTMAERTNGFHSA
jgi:hypothetical protein